MRHIGTLFEQLNYSINYRPTESYNGHIQMETSVSIDLFYIYWLWYEGEEKKLGIDKLTPNILLYWYIGDGAFTASQVVLSSESFSLSENKALVRMLGKIGINSGIENMKSENGKTTFRIRITQGASKKKFFTYLNQASSKEALSLAKRLYPWKFSVLRKKDVIRDKHFFLDFLDLLAHSMVKSGEKIFTRTRMLSCRFPWNEVLFHSSLLDFWLISSKIPNHSLIEGNYQKILEVGKSSKFGLYFSLS